MTVTEIALCIRAFASVLAAIARLISALRRPPEGPPPWRYRVALTLRRTG